MADTRRRRDFTRAEAAEYLTYEPETGLFRWRIETPAARRRIFPGDVAGTLKDGYIQIKLYGVLYRAQHLAWLFMTGDWPDPELDVEHRDRNRANNAWSNLRQATRSQNNMNASIRADNTSGCKGVGLRKDTGKWYARIKVDRRVLLLGEFNDYDKAVAVRRAAERRHFGEFAAA
ncbi:HNH endonuclease [Methylobacterium tarhaniae]|uniref:HNH endonuclease n=1 Tax=Methylobacterium tarhaniae TaxID=1187852 RepID=UPI003CFDBF4B